MIVDRHPVFMVDCVMVRCDECVRQVSVYVGTGVGHDLDTQLAHLGWGVTHSYGEGGTTVHDCGQHS